MRVQKYESEWDSDNISFFYFHSLIFTFKENIFKNLASPMPWIAFLFTHSWFDEYRHISAYKAESTDPDYENLVSMLWRLSIIYLQKLV